MNLNTEQKFAVVPKADIPRSVFDRSFSYKTTMNVNYLVPIFIDEALPGDTFTMDFTAFGRLINPLVVPSMDELWFETLWFKCPNRLLWSNWVKMCGEQENPGDSIDYLVPTINSGLGFANMTLADYFGIPTKVADLDVNALPFRMYNKVYNEWFRPEDIINSVTVTLADSDSASNYTLLKSCKIHDYFTSTLPFAQKFGSVSLPLGDFAPLTFQQEIASGEKPSDLGYNTGSLFMDSSFSASSASYNYASITTGAGATGKDAVFAANALLATADLRNATAANINDIRFAFQLQKYRERSARSGTRYNEYILSMYGVSTGDARLQRTEFLGATRTLIDINTVVQTGSGTTPNGTLTAYAVVGKGAHAFRTSFVEHSYIMGIARIRHNPIYQQGLQRLWSRQSLLDFYNPLFACIGEQPVLNKEIMAQGNTVLDTDGVTKIDDLGFGFQEAWADYRYHPSMITGLLRSNDSASLQVYHFAQYFADSSGNPKLPVLNQDFLEEDIPIERAIAVKDQPQFVFDFHFRYKCARPMPVHSVPGLVDHF